jgi:hypothetical protein
VRICASGNGPFKDCICKKPTLAENKLSVKVSKTSLHYICKSCIKEQRSVVCITFLSKAIHESRNIACFPPRPFCSTSNSLSLDLVIKTSSNGTDQALLVDEDGEYHQELKCTSLL